MCLQAFGIGTRAVSAASAMFQIVLFLAFHTVVIEFSLVVRLDAYRSTAINVVPGRHQTVS
jgi:hypothetical protein